MFTGIVECMGVVKEMVPRENGNVDFKIQADFTNDLVLGQSIAHNGACLTVTQVDVAHNIYGVTAIEETLKKTNLGAWNVGDFVNLERCMRADGRFDGHIVQGHVDCKAVCEEIIDRKGSLAYFFRHPMLPNYMTVEKGSVCVNGISLTVVTSGKDNFSVEIIPFTYENTNMKKVHKGMDVNVEFDIIGKYLFKMHQNLT